MAMIVVTFVGTGSNLWHPAAFSLLAKRYPECKGFAISVHHTGGNLGKTLAPLAIGVALTFMMWSADTDPQSYPRSPHGVRIMEVACQSRKYSSLKGKGRNLHRKNTGQRVKIMGRNKSILLLCLLAGMRSMTQNGLFTFVPIYLAH